MPPATPILDNPLQNVPERDARPVRPNNKIAESLVSPQPTITITDGEAHRPRAVTYKLVDGERLGTLAAEGSIGDLDDRGMDLLAGWIARINGAVVPALPAFGLRNPGGFGLTMTTPSGVPHSTLYPRPDTPDCADWMKPLVDSEGKSGPVKFDSFQAGGRALLSYLDLIRQGKIAYFFHGPMTRIAEVVLIYDHPCTIDVNYSWSALLEHLGANDGPGD